jgi:cbb3-type cytochrome oxidase subunit 1
MTEPDLVNKSVVTAWACWATVWLTLFHLVGILVSVQLHNPEFVGRISWFTFGRPRAVHLEGVVSGSFTTAFIALLYYFAPACAEHRCTKPNGAGGCRGSGTDF